MKEYYSKQFNKIRIVYSFQDVIIKPKWNISKNLSQKTKEIESFTYQLRSFVSKKT